MSRGAGSAFASFGGPLGGVGGSSGAVVAGGARFGAGGIGISALSPEKMTERIAEQLSKHRQIPVRIGATTLYYCACDYTVRSTSGYELHVGRALVDAGVVLP